MESKILPLPGLTPQSRGFHVGPENVLLETIVQQILERSKSTRSVAATDFWNPTTFYGPIGSGKSHLLYGIHQLWKQNRAKAKTLSLTAAEFARAFAVAVETDTTDAFQKRFKGTELWTIDQLEDIQDKPPALEELKRALDEATALGNTVLFATHHAPDEHGQALGKHFPTTLTTRIMAGLTVPIWPASLKTRTEMIREIAGNFHVLVPEQTATDWAQTLEMPYPKIVGVFSQIVLESEKQPPELEFIRTYLQKYEKRTQPTLEEILKFTAKRFSLRQLDIRGKSRSAHIVQGRAVAIFLARQETGHTLKEIGRFFGGRDHKTVAHHCEEMEKRLATDNELRHTIAELHEILASQPRS